MDRREKIVHGDEGLPVAVYDITPRHLRYRMNIHWHPEHEILYVRSGHFRLRLNEASYDLHAGDVVFIPGGVVHSGEPDECLYTCILVNLSLLMKKNDVCMEFSDRLRIGAVSIPPLLGRSSKAFSKLCEEMTDAYFRKGDGYPFEIKGLIFSFFGRILNDRLYSDTAADSKLNDASFGRMKDVVVYMEDNYGNELHLDELARVADMTPNHLCRCFKSVMGITPFAYLISYRLSKARYALVTTDHSVTDISLDCGFNDVSYFIHLFKKNFGMTPNQYRKNNTPI